MFGNILSVAIAAFLIYNFTRFRPARTAEIGEGLYVVNSLFVNFYAYHDGDEISLFDAGLSAALARRGLKRLGLSPDKVTRVFLTHTDFDHAGGLPAFPGAEVFISGAEEQMINGRTARRGILRNRLSRAYKTLKDGETVKIGAESVKLILTPGHTPGSASYLIGQRALVTGDLLRLTRSGEIKPFLWMMNMDHKRDAQSAEAIRDIASRAGYILTGHTGALKSDALKWSDAS